MWHPTGEPAATDVVDASTFEAVDDGDSWLDAALLQAIKGSPDSVVLFDESGTILYANDSSAMFGWAAADLVGKNFGELLPPEVARIAFKAFQNIEKYTAGHRSPASLQFSGADGSLAALECTGLQLTVGDRAVYALLSRRAENSVFVVSALELMASGGRFEEFLGQLPDYISWRLDVPLPSVVWSDARQGRRCWGATHPAELTGVAHDPDERSPWVRAWRGEEQSGSTAELPARLRALARRHDLEAFRIHPIPGMDGSIRVLVTMWSYGSTHAIEVVEARLAGVSRLVHVNLQFHQQQELLIHQAAHDPLTGLFNRRRFLELLEHQSGSAGPTAVLYIDLDGFKPINDDHGHHAGDDVLVEVAQRLTMSCRPDDVVARLGGDEFAVLCRACSPSEAVTVAKRFLDRLGKPFDVAGKKTQVGASVGVAASENESHVQLAALADEAMYLAKRAGGRRIQVAVHRTDRGAAQLP